MKGSESVIEEMTWPDAREMVRAVDPVLADIIDKISPNKHYKLLKVRYGYGDLIFKDGVLQIPQENKQLLSIHDSELDPKLKAKLNYSAIPLLLTLHNSNEVFIDTSTRIIPLNVFDAGTLLGLFESVDYLMHQQTNPKWSVSAGARSIFVLPKINETGGFKRLRMHYRLPSNMKIQSFSDHWQLFKAITSNPNFEQSWHNDILFFTKEWLASRDNDPAWVRFHRYIYQKAWQQARFAIGKIDLSLSWESFVDAISNRRLKPSTYLADQVKHIMLIMAGQWPGFRPADNSQQIAPTLGLQHAITEIYSLKYYLPSIMHAYQFKPSNPLPVYYSLYYPTLLEGSPKNKSSSTIMLDLRDIKLLLEILLESVGSNKKFGFEGVRNTKLEYFHVEADKFEEIFPSKLIPDKDPLLLQETVNFPERTFCATSSFWRGCIRVMANS